MDIKAAGDILPILILCAKIAAAVVVFWIIIFWRIARRMRIKAYGPGQGRR